MPATVGDLINTLYPLRAEGFQTVVLEKINGFIPHASAGAMFHFGQQFGHIQGVTMALGFSVVEIAPKQWQKWFHFGAKGTLTQPEWKNKLKAEAQRRFPDMNITLWSADALLLLEYASANSHLI